MPKRKSERLEEDRWKRKIKKYEAKLRKNTRRIRYTSDEASEPDEPPPPQDVPTPETDEHMGVLLETTEPENQLTPPIQQSSPENVMEASGTVVQIEPISELDPVDPELLRALGDFIPEVTEWGDIINDNLSKILEPVLRDGLKKETKEEILKKYLPPKNCQLSKSPILNPEIAAVLNENARNRDLRILKKQNQLGSILAVLGKIITGMLTKSLDAPDTLKLLSDASKLVADSHFVETETRRALIAPILEKSFVESFKDRKRDSHLFGDKLGEFIKSSRGIKRTGQLIQATASSSSNLNWRGPPPRQFQRNPRQPMRRSGGPRTLPPLQPPTRHRTATAPPPGVQRPAPPPAAPARRTYTAPASRRR